MDSDLLNKWNDWIDSVEGSNFLSEFQDKQNKRQNTINNQIDRLYKVGNFIQFTEKVIQKYNTDKYKDRWHGRGIEPPEDLFWFLFRYAKRYGRVCTNEEWSKYGNMFTSDLFFCDGYYFNQMDGQGSVIVITKISN